jgi:hypothetical protein
VHTQAHIATRFVAGKRIRVSGEWRNPGDPCPEAAHWPNLKAHLNTGAIREEKVLMDGIQLPPGPAAPSKEAPVETPAAPVAALTPEAAAALDDLDALDGPGDDGQDGVDPLVAGPAAPAAPRRRRPQSV